MTHTLNEYANAAQVGGLDDVSNGPAQRRLDWWRRFSNLYRQLAAAYELTMTSVANVSPEQQEAFAQGMLAHETTFIRLLVDETIKMPYSDSVFSFAPEYTAPPVARAPRNQLGRKVDILGAGTADPVELFERIVVRLKRSDKRVADLVEIVPGASKLQVLSMLVAHPEVFSQVLTSGGFNRGWWTYNPQQ